MASLELTVTAAVGGRIISRDYVTGFISDGAVSDTIRAESADLADAIVTEWENPSA